ncbi:MAG: VWA domain-containing protein [Planctomycetota bacterium]
MRTNRLWGTNNGRLAAGVLALVTGMAMGFTPVGNVEAPVMPAVVEPIAPHDRPVIQLALLLDTSNSMDGLIDQARASLWAVVNQLSKASYDGEAPDVQVALIEYGNNGIPASKGHVRLRTNFTTDLDLLSEQLFGLRTNGGDEWCGRAIHEAMSTLRWWSGSVATEDATVDSLSEAAMEAVEQGFGAPSIELSVVPGPVVKLLVIAGNEPFSQGATLYQSAISTARGLDVTVNTVHCGDRGEGARTGWEDGARLGGGLYASIDSNHKIVEPPTPYDKRLGELNAELNATYLPFGVRGVEMADRQMRQDALNSAAGQAAPRAAAKASSAYVQTWDLVDAIDQGGVVLREIDAEQLPEDLQGLEYNEQIAKVNKARDERGRVRAEILKITAERTQFVVDWKAKQAQAPQTLNDALLSAIREQVTGLGYRFDE